MSCLWGFECRAFTRERSHRSCQGWASAEIPKLALRRNRRSQHVPRFVVCCVSFAGFSNNLRNLTSRKNCEGHLRCPKSQDHKSTAGWTSFIQRLQTKMAFDSAISEVLEFFASTGLRFAWDVSISRLLSSNYLSISRQIVTGSFLIFHHFSLLLHRHLVHVLMLVLLWYLCELLIVLWHLSSSKQPQQK